MGTYIRRFAKEDWERFEGDLMRIENLCFSPEIREDSCGKERLLKSEGAIVFLAEKDGRIVGECYGLPLTDLHHENDDAEHEAFDKMLAVYGSEKVLYNYSIGVIHGQRNRGLGKALKRSLIAEAKRQGYRFLVGHAKEGAALEINKGFGAKVMEYYYNWYGTGKTHHLYEIDLRNAIIKLDVAPYKQSKEYTCGPASLKVVFGYYDRQLPENLLEGLVESTAKRGTRTAAMIKAVKEFGFSHISKQGASFDDIEREINMGHPVIVNYYLPDAKSGHYSVVIGYDTDNLYIMDVVTGREVKHPKVDFEKNWFSKNNCNRRWMLIIYQT